MSKCKFLAFLHELSLAVFPRGLLKIFDLHGTGNTTTLPPTALVSVEALETNTSGWMKNKSICLIWGLKASA